MKNIEDIIVAHLNDEASAEQVKRLFEWVREEPENAKEFARCALLHAQLRGQFAGEKRVHASGETLVGRPSTSSQTRKSRRNWKFIAPALAVCLLIAVGASVWFRSAGRGAGDDLIVLALIEQGIANKPVMPFAFEADADVIAVLVMGQPRSGRQQQVIRMELVEVLKGDQHVGSLRSADGVVSFGCIKPENSGLLSGMYREGERVAVYLKRSGDGWSTLRMNHLTGKDEPKWNARIRPFLDVLLASEADNPEQRYAVLLDRALRKTGQKADQLAANGAGNRLASPATSTADGKTKSRSGLSDAAYYGLLYNPDPRAAEFLRKMLMVSVDFGSKKAKGAGLPASIGVPRKPKGTETGAVDSLGSPAEKAAQFADGNPNTFPLIRETRDARRQSTRQLVTLLAKMHDAQSVRPVMIYTASLSESDRISFLQKLPGLCRDADVGTLRFVRGELNQYVAFHKSKTSLEPSPEPRPVRSPDPRPADGNHLEPGPKGKSADQKPKGRRPGDDEQHDYYRTLIKTRHSIEKLLKG